MDFKLPNLGEGADSGTVVNVFVKEGDAVVQGQSILELENEKAVATIPSTAAGQVARVYVKAGDKISVGQRILTFASAASTPSPPPAPNSPEPSRKSRPAIVEEPLAPVAEAGPSEEYSNANPAASPSLRKMARDLGLDLTRIRGSEAGGRIVLADVRAYLARLQRTASPAAPAAAPLSAASPPAPVEAIDFSKWGPITRQPLSPLRQVIARRMAENWRTVPRVTQFDEADITDLLELRKQHAPAYEKKGARLTVTGLILKALAATLKRHPIFNSSLDETAQQIVLKQYIHLGIAVDTEAGLIVPVLRDADKKSLLEISRELEALAQRARERKVSAEELKGGTFTISNQGGIGGGHFTPIINKPEVAILGLGKSVRKPVVRGDKIEPRWLLPLTVAYDHRVIDGGVAARFVVDLVAALESFAAGELSLD